MGCVSHLTFQPTNSNQENLRDYKTKYIFGLIHKHELCSKFNLLVTILTNYRGKKLRMNLV